MDDHLGEEPYDSRDDTRAHIRRVRDLLAQVTNELDDRGVTHDASKLEDPELSTFNEFTPKLKNSTYGSAEYKGFLVEMGSALEHHYANNSHHPERYDNGINGMTLIDLTEMLCDWRAATERHNDGDLGRSLIIQKERFGISDQLAEILENTARELGWLERSKPAVQ